jgi:hypothetical protein
MGFSKESFQRLVHHGGKVPESEKLCHKLVKLAEVINFVICICILLDFKCIIICSYDEYISFFFSSMDRALRDRAVSHVLLNTYVRLLQ